MKRKMSGVGWDEGRIGERERKERERERRERES